MQQLLDSIDVSQLMTQLIAFVPRLVAALVLLVFFWVLARVLGRVLRRLMRGAGMEEALVGLLVDKLFYYGLMVFGVVMAAAQLGVDVGAALAGLGVAGIAVGFAAQDSVANVISGIIIFWDKPFVVGDWIKVEDQFGTVSKITLRSTRIRTPLNTFVVIPNKSIIDAVLENLSAHGELRVDLALGIAYKEDTRAARRVLLAAVRGIDTVKSEPAPDVVVEELGDSSVNLQLRVWIDDAKDRQATYFAVMEAAKLALDEAGIQIPFPHLQLFVDDVEDRVWERAGALRSVGGGPSPAS
ncbi:MAG: mechanosensitive ion channel [Acidobacteriota bacterium]|nr:mechanosensitive ion channel [Acidobacteriota bacterium]